MVPRREATRRQPLVLLSLITAEEPGEEAEPKLLPRKRPGVSTTAIQGNGAPSASRQLSFRTRAPALEGVYVISVASRLLGMHPQTLRKYERVGLINPSRTQGMLRLYSEGDIARLRMIKGLVEILGMNLAGVEMTLRVVNRLLEVRQLLDKLSGEAGEARAQIRRELEEMMQMLHFPLVASSQEETAQPRRQRHIGEQSERWGER